MRRILSVLLSAALAVTLLPILPAPGAGAAYTAEGGTYTWDLTDITDEIGYDKAAFQSGAAYQYHGLVIAGQNTSSDINENGVKIGKVSNKWGHIEYTAPCAGTLGVTASVTKSGSYYSKIYVSTELTPPDGTEPVLGGSAAGTFSGETRLEAGTTYYIYNNSVASAYIKSVSFTPDMTQAVPSMTLNNTFSDNMLIQRDKPIILKGTCAFLDGAEIKLQNDNDPNDSRTETLDLGGLFEWSAELEAVSNYTDTYTLTITPLSELGGAEPIELANIIFGDLYLCAGQSNMVVPASYYKAMGIDYTSEQLGTVHNDIRYFDLSAKRAYSSAAQESVVDGAEWNVLQSGGIPAVAYSFAEKLNNETGIPIGVVISSYQGTYISQWLPNTGIDSNNKDKNLYNTEIYPFRDMRLSGILWYQGESDSREYEAYKDKLKSLIGIYRELFANAEEVPFYYVSIARCGSYKEDDALFEHMSDIRAIQAEVYSELRAETDNFGIIPTLDLYGNKENNTAYNGTWGVSRGNARSTIHPGQKPVIAERAVNWVLRDIYGRGDVGTIGPVYKSKSAADGKLIVEFECTGGLKLMNEDQYSDNDSETKRADLGIDPTMPQEFEVAGEDGVYYRADAELDGSRVILGSGKVPSPVNFRYAYLGRNGDAYVECPNLTDDTNLPALVVSTARGTSGEPIVEEEKERQYIHISFDDVYRCIKDISDNADSYNSVFENEIFAWMKDMHDKYGAVFTLNLFNYTTADKSYDVSNIPSKYAGELTANSDWLKFAFHAYDDDKKYTSDDPDGITADYNKCIAAIMKATNNNADSIDRVTRLGWYGGTEANVKALRECEYGVLGLLTADNTETRKSYYFDDELVAKINADGVMYDDNTDILFLRSQLRMESVTDLRAQLDKIGGYDMPRVIELFSHEGQYYNDSKIEGYTVPQLIEEYLKWAAENGYGFDFAQNRYKELLYGADAEPTEPPAAPDKGFVYNRDKEAVTCYENGVLTIADYNDGVLENIDMRRVTDENREFGVEAVPGRKIMLWDSAAGMKPLCGAVTIPAADGSTPAPTEAAEETETAEPTEAAEETETAEPTEEVTSAPEHDAELYAVYTIDGTSDGEISRAKLLSGNSGDTVSVPAEAFGARRFSDADGLYDIYAYVSGGTEPITLNEGENTVYITVRHEDGKYYCWEDFESCETGDMPTDSVWYHGGASTVSGFIRCTTDTANTTTAARWYSGNTSGSRSKTFAFYDGTPSVPDGEQLVFSADFRISATRNANYRTSLSFGSGAENMFLISVANSITATVNDSDTVILPSVKGTEEETGGSDTAFSKWLNVKITIDPSKTENNTTVELTSLTDGDKFTVNGTERDSYTYTMTSSVCAVTQMGVNLCRGYRGAVVADNIKLYNTQSEYLTPAMNELRQAIAIYGGIDKSLYTARNISAYDIAVSTANSVLADAAASNKAARDAKAALVNAASALELKSERDGGRTVINENADWIFIKEKNYQSEISEITASAPDELSLSGWSGVDVPHTWNAHDGSDDTAGYDKCKSWYRKSMYIDESFEGQKLYLEFDGASIRTELYINGVHVPFSFSDPFGTAVDGIEYEHKGAFNTFRFDVTDYVKYGGANTVAVSVDNRIKADTLPLSGDYTRAGGMYRDVSLIATNPVHADMTDDGSCGLYLTPRKKTSVEDDTNKDFTLTAAAKIVNDSDSDKTVKIEAVLGEPDHYDVPDNDYIKNHLRFDPKDMYTEGGKTVEEFETKTVTIKAGEAYDYADTVEVLSPKLWDGLDSPYRYEVKLKITADGAETESLTETVGFRYFRAPDPTGINSGGSFYLNGRNYPINGVGKHQDWGKGEDALGIATTEKEMLSDAATIYELGANGVRLVHYQHSLDEIELYDKLGITVWSEPALCSAMTNANAEAYPAFEKATLYQLGAMIKQQYNKPCVLFWGFSNEITHEWDDNLKQIASEERKFTSAPALFKKMQDMTKELDPVRLTTYAANTRKHTGDLYTDITGSNLYPYWYVSRSATNVLKDAYAVLKQYAEGDKPLSLSEYGGSAVVGNTYEYNEDGSVDFLGTDAESNMTYQAYIHERVHQQLMNSCTALWGRYIWQLFDSASDGKTDGSVGGINTKGLVSYDHTTKKDAYYFYKANWNDFEPFAFVVNASRTERPDTTTIIRAYSNADLCQLYLNGEKYGEPITDTNENDAVPDGVHVFMWYDVPLAEGGNTVEVRGMRDGTEICSSADTNGEIVFTSSFTGVSMKSNDTSVITVGDDSVSMQCMAGNAPGISDIPNLVKVLSTSSVSVVMADGTAVTGGRLSEGMRVRVTASDGTYKDYEVTVDDLAETASVTASNGANASMLNDGNTASSWTADSAQSIVMDLGAEYTINGADIFFDSPAPYKIQVSADGTSYTDASNRDRVSETITSDKFASGTVGRYIKIKFSAAVSVSEINIYGWRFDNIGNYVFDGNDIYLGETSAEHDTDEVNAKLKIVGQASYEFELAEAGRVLSDGDILKVTEKHGETIDYTLRVSDK